MLQLSSDARLLKEAGFMRRLRGAFGKKFFEGDVSAELAVVRQPHAADVNAREADGATAKDFQVDPKVDLQEDIIKSIEIEKIKEN
jgi:hypothetical protein